jgi:hypothetical protein
MTRCKSLTCDKRERDSLRVRLQHSLRIGTFAKNTAVQSTLQECSFFLFFRRLPVLPNDIKLDFKLETTGEDAFMSTKKWMQAQRLACIHLFEAQEKQKFNYNQGAIKTKYEVGDWVLSTPNGWKIYQPLEWPI